MPTTPSTTVTDSTTTTIEVPNSSSLPSPPVSKVDPPVRLLRSPPFLPPPEASSSSSVAATMTATIISLSDNAENGGIPPADFAERYIDKDNIVLNDLEYFVASPRSHAIAGTTACFMDTMPNSMLSIMNPGLSPPTLPRIPFSPLTFLPPNNGGDRDDSFTFDTNDFILLDYDSTSPPLSPEVLFPPL